MSVNASGPVWAVKAAALHAGTEEAVEQDGKHDQRESNIHAIAFEGESHDGEDDAGDGGGDEEEQSELD